MTETKKSSPHVAVSPAGMPKFVAVMKTPASHMIVSRTLAVMLVLLFVAALPAGASLNLRLTKLYSNQVTMKLSKGYLNDDVDTIISTGTDPYFQTRGLSRSLESSEVYLSFDYMSSADVRDLQLFFGSPASEARSAHYGKIAKATTWTTCTIDISAARKNFSWGSAGEVLRLDFGYDAGVTIMLRHLRICRAGNDPWVPTTPMPTDLASIFRLGLPVFNIETVDHEEPTCDYVACPAGSMGAGIRNTTKVPGKLDIYFTDSITPDYSSGEYQQDVSGITFRIRGNTSAYTEKKPYKIKLQKKANLMLRGDNATYKDKDWVLLKDPNLLTLIGCRIGELMGLQWSPRCRYVNVMVNGDYRGMYLLMESVKRNKDARLNVGSDGYVFELDPYWWNEDGQYVNSKFTPSYNYTFKYPDWEDMDEAQTDYIQNVITTYENSVGQATYTKYIDVESFAAWLLGHDLFGTYDSGGSNMYFTKYDSSDTTLIRMANMWDFDSAEMLRDAWSNLHIHRFPQFFESQNKEFARKYVKKWNEIKGTFFTDILDFVDDFAASDEGKAFDNSIKYDNERWDYTNQGLAHEVEQTHNWFDRRKVWLPQAIATIDTAWFVKEQSLAMGGTIRIQAEDYCEGGKEVSYLSHNTTRGSYRADNEGVNMTSGDEYGNGWAIIDMGDGWSKNGLNLTRDEAIEQWGAWYNYTFNAEEDMEIVINLKAGVHWSSYGIISVYGSQSSIVGEPELTNWVKKYTASTLLLLDGEELKPNQTSHPVNTAVDKEAYTALLQDKSQWTANPADDNALWFYPNYNNMSSWASYYQKDVYGEPDNFTVNVSKGQHTICVKSLASQWLFDEMSLEGRQLNAIGKIHTAAFSLRADGTTIHIDLPTPGAVAEVFDFTGRRVYSGTDTAVDVGTPGVYIVRVAGQAKKILVR